MFLSAVILTKNSERHLVKCLQSVEKVADEVIIVDSGSVDNTLVIGRNFNCKIISTPWLGYGQTKNLGNNIARFGYVISIDSDEELSEALIDSINQIKPKLKGYYSFRRLNNFCGKWIKYGSWYPDVKIRIFPRNTSWDKRNSHERLVMTDKLPVTQLDGNLFHYAYDNLEELKRKTLMYGELGRLDSINKNVFLKILKMLFSPLYAFLKSFLLKRGFMDGVEGYYISKYIALVTYYKYKI